MNAVVAQTIEPALAPARVALLGVGTVGSALLQRLQGWQGTALGECLPLVYVANSRVAVHLRPSPSGAPTHGSRATGARASERPRGERGPGREAGVGVRVRRSIDSELTTKADSLRDSSADTASPYPHPPPDQEHFGGRLFGHVDSPRPMWLTLRAASPSKSAILPICLPEGEGKSFVRSELDNIADALGDSGTRILIDATASDAVAARHADWLARGINVVTACKLAQGTGLQRWRAIQAARAHGKTEYGDAATVGAGLPLLRSIRELRAGGDRIHAIAGVLSGSLAWLFDHYDGKRPFSRFVREARAAGYTEPDPREDLSGEDVRRKLLILARAAGVELEAEAVEVESLVPALLAAASSDEVDTQLAALDAPLRERFAEACKRGEKLRFIARLQDGRARVGLESLPAGHPLASGAGTDNKLAIWSDRYREQPLVIQGPGAGAEVTAAALLDDALRIAAGAH